MSTSEKKNITITVEGAAHTGKSTIIAIVHQALKDQGFEDVEVKMIADEPGIGFKALPVAIARTRIAKVVIQEKQADVSA